MMNLFRFITVLICLCATQVVFGQAILIKDLDGDQLNDTIKLDRSKGLLLCRLSSRGFQLQNSKVIGDLSTSSGLETAKNGFNFFNYQMRSGYICQFRFNKKARKVELIGMSRYNDGNAQLDGSGESSVNLLTGNYIGNWNCFDERKKKLRKIGPISQKLNLPQTFLEGFSDTQPELYRQECEKIFKRQAGR